MLMGDAAHTAHFSIGSGTKLAMEDAAGLYQALNANPESIRSALAELRGGAQAAGGPVPGGSQGQRPILRVRRPSSATANRRHSRSIS